MKVGEPANYKIKEKIGWGGMGVVYIAEDLNLGRLVALKFLAPYLVQDQEIMERFRAEARNQARLVHPNITMVYAFHEAEDQAFLVLEYVDGETLENRLKRQGRFSVAEALGFFRPVLQAVDYAHSRGIIHRDLKPGNIGLTSEGIIKVMDFGIALNIEETSRLTKTGHIVGSPHYMAPEQILGQPSHHRTDIYALGITLFEMLTGQVPFDAATDYQIRMAQINEPVPSPRALGFTDIPPALENAIIKAMAKDPHYRFADIRDFQQALEASMSGEGVITTPQPTLFDMTTQVVPVSRPAGEAPPPRKAPIPMLAPRSSTPSLLPLLIPLAVVVAAALVAIPLYFGSGGGRSTSPPPAPVIAPQVVVTPPEGPATPPAPKSPPGYRAAPLVVSTPESPPTAHLEAGATTPLNSGKLLGGPESRPSESGKIPEKVSSQKTSDIATPPPEFGRPGVPPLAPGSELNHLKLLKTRLTEGGFPKMEVSSNEKGQLTVAGRVQDKSQKEKVEQIGNSLGISEPITYLVTIAQKETPKKVKKKEPKKKKKSAKRRTGSSEEEAPAAPPSEEPVRSLQPKYD